MLQIPLIIGVVLGIGVVFYIYGLPALLGKWDASKNLSGSVTLSNSEGISGSAEVPPADSASQPAEPAAGSGLAPAPPLPVGTGNPVVGQTTPPPPAPTDGPLGAVLGVKNMANSLVAQNNQRAQEMMDNGLLEGSGGPLGGKAPKPVNTLAQQTPDPAAQTLTQSASVSASAAPPASEEPKDPLFEYALNAKFTSLQNLVQSGEAVDTRDKDGFTPLAQVLIQKPDQWQTMARFLLSLKASPQARQPKDTTPLHLATATSDTGLVDSFLKTGVSVNLRDAQGRTPLHIAAMLPRDTMALFLLEHGARVQARDIEGKSPLLVAVENNQEGVAAMLLAKGARPNVWDSKGRMPLTVAQKRGNFRLVRLLEGHGGRGLDEMEVAGLTQALHQATLARDRTQVRALVQRGVDVDARDAHKRTALWLASWRGYTDLAEDLLAYGAEPRAPSQTGLTPLHAAARAGRYEIVALLLASGAGLDDQDQEARTPLDYAALAGEYQTARILLEKGANPNPPKPGVDGPLHFAVAFKQPKVVELLLTYGANMGVRGKKGFNALELASRTGQSKLSDWMKNR